MDWCNSMALSTTLALSQSLHLPAAAEHRAQVLCCKNGGLGLQLKTLALPQVKLAISNLQQLRGHVRPSVAKKVHVAGRRGYVVTCAVDDNGSSSSDGAASSDDEVVTPGAGGAAGAVDSNVSLTSSSSGQWIWEVLYLESHGFVPLQAHMSI